MDLFRKFRLRSGSATGEAAYTGQGLRVRYLRRGGEEPAIRDPDPRAQTNVEAAGEAGGWVPRR
jgi:hypothetical protein